VRRSREELERTELVPFRAAIAAGVPMLMTAHVLYPALDPDHPATLSRAILTDLLRTQLGFDGVVASDDLEMRAIGDKQTIGDAAVATLAAGADVLLVCEHLSQAELACDAIERAVADGVLQPHIVTTACERIQRVRELRARLATAACVLPNLAHRALVTEPETPSRS
jgi:beta-N-acetylhexosaminidase